MTSTSASTQQSRPLSTAAIVGHGRIDVGGAIERVQAVAERAGVEIVDDPTQAQVVVALGGDGTILRTLRRLLGTGVPVIGVNYGRVGFLASIEPDRLEQDLARVLAGEFRTLELATLEAALDGERRVAVNDVVVTSATLGRMVELHYAVGGEEIETIPCDGLICATPTGSTAYNLSNGGPVLVRGVDAFAVTFIAPHSLHARPLVIPRGVALRVENRSHGVEVAILVDGLRVATASHGESVSVYLCDQRSLLATLPETTFFGRYREVFASG